MERSTSAIPIPIRRALRKLGADIRDARLRRRIPTTVMAERASISRTTLSKVEKGQPGVSMGSYATVLFVLGMAERLSLLADVKSDTVGLELEEERLPKRIRKSGQRKSIQPDPERRKRVRTMDTEVLVYVDVDGVPCLTGRLWTRTRKNRQSATFEYDETWLSIKTASPWNQP